MYNSEIAYKSILELQKHAQNNTFILSNLFHQHNRDDLFSASTSHIDLNYAKNLITQDTRNLFIRLLDTANIKNAIQHMLSAKCMNTLEQRPALHIALRSEHDLIPAWVKAEVKQSLQNMHDFCYEVHTKQNITDIIHIGIGGSDLGAKMVYHALAHQYTKKIQAHFLNNIDAAQLEEILAKLNPQHTLVMVCSKTFTTLETCQNLTSCIEWLKKCKHIQNYTKHLIAISANTEQPKAYGIEHIFHFADWVGGRFSLWSAVGLVIMLCYGSAVFKELLQGAANMDTNFIHAPFEKNLAQILAMLGIWYRNAFHIPNYCIAAYAQNLNYFTAYLQQLDMESNGKSVGMDNKRLPYHTAPVVFGEVGTHCQHAYFQLLHQGTQWIPVDFIAYSTAHHNYPQHHQILLQNCLAQAKALMLGKHDNNPHLIHVGNRPSNMLMLKDLSAFSIGSLLAMYEHKIFTQGIFWHINSFDQWGVEFGKHIAKQALNYHVEYA
jgi:glucose-6-phosphate isomerase